MRRRKFLHSLAIGTASLTLAQFDTLMAAAGFHDSGPYNGPLLISYVNSTCGACPGGCGIRVRKVDDIPVKIDGNPLHPVNRGGLCPVGVSSLAFLVHPDRIRQPLLRTGSRGSGEFKAISWDEAERLIVDNLSQLKKTARPEQLLFVDSREKGPGLELAREFTFDFGSPNFYHTLESNSIAAASIWGGDGTSIGYDLENAQIIFCFGHPVFESGKNPVYFAGLRNRLLRRPERDKGSFYVIDPRLSASAAKAERWIPINPNTYDLLALGMIYIIIKEKLYDVTAASRYCVGFEDETKGNGRKKENFKSFVLKNYYPSFVSEMTGVPVDQIITLARLFATTPKAIAISGSGVSQTINGTYQEWAIMALNALTGKFGKRGGINSLKSFPFKAPRLKKVKAKPMVTALPDKFPYLSGVGSIESLPESILLETPYPIKVAIINNVNLIYDSPQSNRFRQAFQNIPFSVVFSSIHNETTALADLILPDCTFFEKNDLVIPSSDFSRPVVSLTQPVIKPLFESRQSDEVLLSMGKRLLDGDWKKWNNYRSYLEEKLQEIYQTNTGTLFSEQFEVSLKSLLAERGWRRKEYSNFDDFLVQLREAGGWWDQLLLPEMEKNRFPTTSGKFFLDSRPLRNRFKGSKIGLKELLNNSGLVAENGSGHMLGAYGNREEDKESYYPLTLYLFQLTTSRGEGGRLSTMADMAGYYQDVKWHSWVEINPETAKSLGLSNKQLVWVKSDNGRQQLRLLFNPGLMPEVAAIPVGFGKKGSNVFGENVNNLISNNRDFFTGMPAKAETKVRITPG